MILLILLLALALRLVGLGKSLWLDEVMTVGNASRSFVEMIRHLADFDAHPPLYQSIEWLWLQLGGGDAFARLPSVAAGVLGVWLTYLIARRLLDRRAGLAAAFLMAVSCFHIYYSQEARLNALVTTLFLAQTWLLLRILHQRGRAGWGLWAAYGLAGLLCLYTYALCILTIGALALLYLWLSRTSRRQIVRLLVVHLLIGLLFLPWVPTLRKTTARVTASVEKLQDAAGRPGPAGILSGVAAWGFGPYGWSSSGMYGTALGVALLAAAGVALGARRSRRTAKFLGVLFLLPLAGYLLMPMPRVQEYDPKHLIFLQPILIIALAGARIPVTRCAKRRRFPLLLCVVLAVVSLNALALGRYYRPTFQKENWPKFCQGLGAQCTKEDVILFNPGRLGFAYDRYSVTTSDKATMEDMLKYGGRIHPRYQRLWLIECRSAVSKPFAQIRNVLAADGWQAGEQATYPGVVGELQWTLYTRGTISSKRAEP